MSRTALSTGAVACAILACSGYAPTAPTEHWSTTTTTFIHAGVAAGPVAVTATSGALVEERRAEPFGANIGTANLAGLDLNALNKRTDPDTLWSYHGARWMAADNARWLTPDPPVKTPGQAYLAAPWELHPYQYVNQNPATYWDPDGRRPEWLRIMNAFAGGRPVSAAEGDAWIKGSRDVALDAAQSTVLSVVPFGTSYAELLEGNFEAAARAAVVEAATGAVGTAFGAGVVIRHVVKRANGRAVGVGLRHIGAKTHPFTYEGRSYVTRSGARKFQVTQIVMRDPQTGKVAAIHDNELTAEYLDAIHAEGFARRVLGRTPTDDEIATHGYLLFDDATEALAKDEASVMLGSAKYMAPEQVTSKFPNKQDALDYLQRRAEDERLRQSVMPAPREQAPRPAGGDTQDTFDLRK